ncbi:hypothetical protein GCK72_020924 [Caenorhabditis remanei]|uniref:Uncharacterized protein n=1 Tax=Caenorhabditis remanei TaxID=31234 RepID=A0A6A5GI59_CAERE|nr:hypothetical protein GCK72_020924 [Caenorhabditis remanei]KAF1754363.1 hypothetical protein GCK72_020924 [Caenorhabditis remanei]
MPICRRFWIIIITVNSFFNYYKFLLNLEPECVFNQTVLTSETIKLFPKCEDVYAIIVINEKTDLTSSQIKTYFKKMEMLLGGFRIENSNLTDLAFLTRPKEYSFTVWCESYGVFIRNNSNLKSEFKLPAIYILGNENGTMNCRFEVENNTKLNADMMCGPPYHNTDVDVKITGNLKDCGEQLEHKASNYVFEPVTILTILSVIFCYLD